MSAEDRTLNDCSQWQVIEKISQHFPYIGIFIFSGTLVEESIILGDGTGLVISSQDRQSLFISDLETEE